AAHFVAWLILTHLGELHSLPLEHRTVFAGEERVHEAARAQLEQPHLPEDVGGNASAGRGKRGVGRLGQRMRLRFPAPRGGPHDTTMAHSIPPLASRFPFPASRSRTLDARED